MPHHIDLPWTMVNDDLTTLRLRVAENEARINEIQLETKGLLAELASKKLVATHIGVNDLPCEILGEILTLCVEPIFREDPDEFGNMQVDFKKYAESMPIVVRNVCKYWWDVTNATSAVWSTLHLSFSDLPATVLVSGAADRLVEAWVKNAGSRPLTLVLGHARTDEEVLHMRRIIEWYAPRTSHLVLEMDVPRLVALGLKDVPFPVLTRASLLCEGDFEGEPEEEVDVFSAAPNLCWMDTRGIPSEIALPWAQLTTFEGAVNLELLLKFAPNLRVARLHLEYGGLRRMLTHTEMRSFACTGELDELSWLSFPNLHSLDIGVDRGDMLGQMERFVAAAGPQLESLRIPGTAVVSLDAAWALFQRLEFLELHDVTEDEINKVLQKRRLRSLKSLKKLTLSGLSMDATPMENLVNFLDSRQGQIELFRVRWRRRGKSDITRRMRAAGHAELERLGRGPMLVDTGYNCDD
ncbi:hypothetical protein C8R46DRAFT_1131251 [Mycena filopes]|nr:hypothetical protein C8R46DRAFT_1131251 [Mycena filopes]